MFHIFSGLYSIEQCAKALEFNNNDVELATINIVSESEKTPKDEKSIQLTRSTILCESEVKYVEGNRPIEKENSILRESCIQCGKWSIDQDQVTFYSASDHD